MNKDEFETALEQALLRRFGRRAEDAEVWQLHECIGSVVMEDISAQWKKSTEAP